MTNDIYIKNPQTGKIEIIKTLGIEAIDWGLRFFVASELEAYKAAYAYDTPNGKEVKYSNPLGQWYVTIFNDKAKRMGVDGAI